MNSTVINKIVESVYFLVETKSPVFVISQMITCLSMTCLFIAIAIDFSLFHDKNKETKKKKKSIVETGTMTFFMIIFSIVIVKSSSIKIPTIVDIYLCAIGTLFVVTGCILNIIGRFNLGSNWANHIKIYNNHSLVQTGLYSIVRHPLYSSIMLMFYGACLIYKNMYAFALVSFLFIPFMYYRAKQEEVLLINFFSEYEIYRQRVGMFFPKIFKYKKR